MIYRNRQNLCDVSRREVQLIRTPQPSNRISMSFRRTRGMQKHRWQSGWLKFFTFFICIFKSRVYAMHHHNNLISHIEFHRIVTLQHVPKAHKSFKIQPTVHFIDLLVCWITTSNCRRFHHWQQWLRVMNEEHHGIRGKWASIKQFLASN